MRTDDDLLQKYKSLRKRVAKYTREWELIEEYDSIKSAADHNSLDFTQISKVCLHPERYKSSGGYYWKYI
jgi:hypothetical protein